MNKYSRFLLTPDLNQWHIQEKGVCSDSNWTALPNQLEACKSFGTISGMILNWLQPKFAAKTVENEIQCWKPCRHILSDINIPLELCENENPEAKKIGSRLQEITMHAQGFCGGKSNMMQDWKDMVDKDMYPTFFNCVKCKLYGKSMAKLHLQSSKWT